MNNKTSPFFVVINRNGRMPTVQHDTLQAATNEAERLAIANPGVRFEVFEWIGTCTKNTVSLDRPEQREQPF
jgi:hypothetical protein